MCFLKVRSFRFTCTATFGRFFSGLIIRQNHLNSSSSRSISFISPSSRITVLSLGMNEHIIQRGGHGIAVMSMMESCLTIVPAHHLLVLGDLMYCIVVSRIELLASINPVNIFGLLLWWWWKLLLFTASHHGILVTKLSCKWVIRWLWLLHSWLLWLLCFLLRSLLIEGLSFCCTTGTVVGGGTTDIKLYIISFPPWFLSCCLSNLFPDVANLNSWFEERCIIISAARSRSSELRHDPPWLLPFSDSSSLLSNAMSSFCCWFSAALLSDNYQGFFVNLLWLFSSCIVVDGKSCCLLLLSPSSSTVIWLFTWLHCVLLCLLTALEDILILFLWPIDEFW